MITHGNKATEVTVKTDSVGYLLLSRYERMQADNMAMEIEIDRVSSGNSRILDTSTNDTPAIEILNIVFKKNFSIFFISIVVAS